MKIYTVTIDGQPEKESFTTILTLVNKYKLPHRAVLNGVKENGRYITLIENKIYVVTTTELKKCKRRVNPKKENINHY